MKNVKNYFVSFTDLMGVQRAKLVPASKFENLENNGVGFAGFAAWFDVTPSFPDIMGFPSENGYSTEVPNADGLYWLPAELKLDGNVLNQNPRQVLINIVEKFKQDFGFTPKSGVEAEFMLLNNKCEAPFFQYDSKQKPCYDQNYLSDAYSFISDITNNLNSLGWGCYQADHEDANGQFEINWDYDESLMTADKHSFFKFYVKKVAREMGEVLVLWLNPLKIKQGMAVIVIYHYGTVME